VSRSGIDHVAVARVDCNRSENRGNELVRNPLPATTTVEGSPDAANASDKYFLIVIRVDGDVGYSPIDVSRPHGGPNTGSAHHRDWFPWAVPPAWIAVNDTKVLPHIL